MRIHSDAISLLVAEDDPDDRLMIRDAFDELHNKYNISFVEDGEELIDFLKYYGKYKNSNHELPSVILLDLNMPRKDGREALAEIKQDDMLKHIPVLVLTTSMSEDDVNRSYEMGVAGFMKKPVTFHGLVDVLKMVGEYWLEMVELPYARHQR